MKLEGAVAVITGGGGTMGTGIARLLTEHGVVVAKWDLDPPDDSVVACDVSDPASVDAAFESTLRQHGKPTILVNAAGVSGGKSPRATEAVGDEWDDVLSSTKAWQAVLDVNILGVVNTTRAFARLWSPTSPGTAIINITSVAGTRMNNGVLTAYSASKAAVNKITKIAAVDFSPLGIRVNAIAPGSMEVRMRATGTEADPTAAGQTGDGRSINPSVNAIKSLENRAGRAEDIANAVLGLLAADFVTGEVLHVDGGQMLQRSASGAG